MGRALSLPTAADVQAARERISGTVVRSPLLRLDGVAGTEVFVKLENLQPIGSFKLRGALNRLRAAAPGELRDGVYTASAGNMAQGVAWAARELGVPASVIVPDSAPQTKLAAIQRLGAAIVAVPYQEWWDTMERHGRDGFGGVFVHPFADREVMAGNATIALEILEDVPDVDTVIVPWGGGGLACGIAAGLRAGGSRARVLACEVEHSAPLATALAAGEPRVIDNRRSFVDGIGGRSVFAEMWPLARDVIAASLVVSLEQVADALRLLVNRAHVVAEGAGAAALAAGIAHRETVTPVPRRVACIVSGGNIDAAALATILSGSIP